MSDQYLAQRMADLTQRLLPLLTKEDLTQTAIADISLMHRSNPSQARPIIYRPAVCFMLQGAKELLVGNTKVTYEQMNYLLIPVMLPVSGRVSQASPDTPYVGLSFNFHRAQFVLVRERSLSLLAWVFSYQPPIPWCITFAYRVFAVCPDSASYAVKSLFQPPEL